MISADTRIVGVCDGVKGDQVYGWAWAPDHPEQVVEVQLCLDGMVVASAAASHYRADLRAAGIGNGRYGWYMPLPRRSGGAGPMSFVARVKDGAPLADGVFEHDPDPPLDDASNAELQAFVRTVVDPASSEPVVPSVRSRPVTNFLLYSAAAPDSRALGAAEYSYGFVMKAFRPLLERLGRVHLVGDGSDHVPRIVDDAIARGEAAILISFAPPHRTPLDVRCPIVPVVAWEFPTIPDRAWAGDPRHDWRFVLRQTGRAIALCETAAAAMRAAMGASYPAISIPTPVWDRFPELQALPPPTEAEAATLAIDGFVFDTRGRSFATGGAIPAIPDLHGVAPEERLSGRTAVGGIVFTAVLAPKDGRKNWPDVLTAFVAAFREVEDATLVIKMVGTDPGLWWWDAHELLGKERPFVCRVVVLHGYLDEARYNALIGATHWIVNASKAEGQCLPLLEFMCAGRPAIAPRNTAMCDYIDGGNALIVDSSEEYCGWPHDPLNEMTTTRHRVNWSSLRDRYAEAHRLVRDERAVYRALGDAARQTMRDYCGDEIVGARLDAFLGLGLGIGTPAPSPSRLLEETRRA